MKQEVEIVKYDPNKGLELDWKTGFTIEVKSEGNEVLILANEDGLFSLANHLLTLAQNEIPPGTHIHYDEYNSLENGSVDLIIEKVDS